MDEVSRRRARVLEDYLSAITAQDPERVATFYTEDYVLELPYHKPGETLVVEGRDTVLRYLRAILARQQMVFSIERVHAIPEEDLLIAEYTSEGQFTDTAEAYANRYVGYYFFAGDRLCRLREYYNPQMPGASAVG